jgi:hypothetical protein
VVETTRSGQSDHWRVRATWTQQQQPMHAQGRGRRVGTGRSALTGCCCPMEMRDPSAWQPKEGVRRGIVTSKGVHTSGTRRAGPGRPPLLSAGSCGERKRRVDWGGNARVIGWWSKPHTSKR